MNTDRFRDITENAKKSVLAYEAMVSEGGSKYFDLDQLLEVIDFYLNDQDLQGLEGAVAYAKSLFPSSTDVKLRQTYLLNIKGYNQQALSLLENLIQVEPHNTEIAYTMGVTLGTLERHEQAISFFKKALGDQYEQGLVYGNIGDEYYKLQDYDQAVIHYQNAIEHDIEEERSFINLTQILLDKGEEDKGIEFFEKIIEKHPYCWMAWHAVSILYSSISLFEKAIDADEYALAIEGNAPDPYFHIAENYMHLSDPQKAIQVLHEAADRGLLLPEVFSKIAQIYLHIQNFETATIYARRVLDEVPQSSSAWHYAGYCYAMMEDYHSATHYYDKAVSLDPDVSIYLLDAALAHEQVDECDTSEIFYLRAIQVAPQDESIYAHYAEFLIDQDRAQEAIPYLEDALRKCENVLPINALLSVAFYLTGHRNRLFTALRACLEDDPDSLTYIFSRCPNIQYDQDVMNIIASYHVDDTKLF